MRGAYGLIAHILDGTVSANQVRQISIKTYNSPSLPIFSGLMEEERKAYREHGSSLE